MLKKITGLAAIALAVTSFTITDASAKDQDVVRDARNNIVHSTNGNCVRTKWRVHNAACVRQAYKHKSAYQKKQRTVYFAFNSAKLDQNAKNTLDKLAERVMNCGHKHHVNVVGYADRMGKKSYNDALSRKRADAVQAYLAKRGISSSTIEVRALGESNSRTSCEKGMKRDALIECLAKDRRVEVEVSKAK